MKVTVPAGKYYLGDPCYSFSEGWSKLLDETKMLNEPLHRDGKVIVAFGTAYGDGIYEDQVGRAYPVDAGLIGLVPVELAEIIPDDSHVVEFTEPTVCAGENGVMRFGKIVIDTRGESTVDDYDPDYEN